MDSHRINYYGLELEVYGNYEKPESDTGYYGGWATQKILINDIDVSWMFTDQVIDQVSELVIEENY